MHGTSGWIVRLEEIWYIPYGKNLILLALTNGRDESSENVLGESSDMTDHKGAFKYDSDYSDQNQPNATPDMNDHEIQAQIGEELP